MNSSEPSTKEVLLDVVEQALGQSALETVEPVEIEIPNDTSMLCEKPTCITQNPTPRNLRKGPSDIVVGLGAQCPRWVPGSVINWTAWCDGYNSREDADHAAEHLLLATNTWNTAAIGVTFKWVPDAKDATFVLCHGGSQGNVLASAFFPNSNDLNFIYVYTYAFNKEFKKSSKLFPARHRPYQITSLSTPLSRSANTYPVWKIFLHELGHVLGLRHEFAIGDVPSSMDAEGLGGVRLDDPDEFSVMNYRQQLPELQQSDIQSTRKFYNLRLDQEGNPPMIKTTPVVDYTPR